MFEKKKQNNKIELAHDQTITYVCVCICTPVHTNQIEDT